MNQESTHKSMLVKICTYDDEDPTNKITISTYYTPTPAETLKMYIIAKDYGVRCRFNEFSDAVSEEYRDGVMNDYIVEDVNLCFPSNDMFGKTSDIPVIEVIV